MIIFKLNMKTALSFFIFFTICWTFVKSTSAQKPAFAISSASVIAEILAPASIEIKQAQEFNILDLAGLIVKLNQFEKNRDLIRIQNLPQLQMNFAEFALNDYNAQQFAVTIPVNATGTSIVNGKSYVTATESLSIIGDDGKKTARQAFKVRGILSFHDRSYAGNMVSLSPLIVTVNFN